MFEILKKLKHQSGTLIGTIVLEAKKPIDFLNTKNLKYHENLPTDRFRAKIKSGKFLLKSGK